MIKPGQALKIEKLKDTKEGGAVNFDKVLLLIDGEEVKIGKPYLDKTQVSATVKKEGRAKKITILKYKAKVRHRKKAGHRQPFTEIVIGEIK